MNHASQTENDKYIWLTCCCILSSVNTPKRTALFTRKLNTNPLSLSLCKTRSLPPMSTLACRNAVTLFSEHKKESGTRSDVCSKIPVKRGAQHVLELSTGQGSMQKIKEMLQKVELSVSPYDTAWVSMVPAARDSSYGQQQEPRFPQCLQWIVENQHPDGSWAFHPAYPLLVKDSLSTTLACILALRKWNLGEQLVNKGLDFIGSNAWAIFDTSQHVPLGFDVIFPGMIQNALDMDLNLPFPTSSVHAMLQKRDIEIQSALRSNSDGKKANLAYVAEGLSKFTNWKDVMKHQRRNGSLFNSPSATAASLLHVDNDKSSMYLQSLLQRYGNAVPTIYPLDVYTRLCMVDNLVRLGIDHYFTTTIKTVLDEIYRSWLDGDEEIFLDIPCLAMGFRLLRMNGYDVSSEALSGLDDQEHFFSSTSMQFQNTSTIFELYRASQIAIFPNEPILERMNEWTSSFLKQALRNGDFHDKISEKEVEYDLKYAHASLERLESRKSIELHRADSIRLLKTSYSCFNTDNRDSLQISLQDFNACQYIYRKELASLERWVKDHRIDQLKFARQKIAYGYFAAASVLYSPELSDARCSWAKNTVLVTLIDDFFDFAGSEEELLNLMELVEKWERHPEIGFCSEQVEIIFSAVYETTNEYAEKASKEQGWNVISHLIEMWLVLLKCMRREAEWARNKAVPPLDDYMEAGYVSVALGPVVLVPLYFLGCRLSEEAVRSAEYDDLFRHMSMIARLLNDLATVKRERAQGKLNSLLLRMMDGHSEEDARKETRRLIESHRRELLRMVLRTKGSVVPRVCKDLCWKTSKIVHLFYLSNDGYSSQEEMVGAMNSVIHEPIRLPQYST